VGFENEKVRDESMEAMEGTPLRRSLSQDKGGRLLVVAWARESR
jgi:hypothetical protein